MPLSPSFNSARNVWMVDEENRTLIGLFRFEHHFHQPFGGFQLFRMVPEFPTRNFLHDAEFIRNVFQRDVAGAADLAQGIEANGIEGLNTTIEQTQATHRTRAF